MLLEFKKGTSVFLSKHFKSEQFDCKCKNLNCEVSSVEEELLTGLEALRELIGEFIITSAYRCVPHNQAVGGKANSQHILGRAVDIMPKTASIQDVVKAAKDLGCFGGIGREETFVHLDVRNDNAYWEY